MISNIEQSNLYIKLNNYNTNYNFYNYNKFKILKNLPITYKSPTIFLDGLYFELSRLKIISISKNADSMIYKLNLQINKSENSINESENNSKNNIIDLLKKINEYNKIFFSNNKEKFMVKITKSNKKYILRNDDEQNVFKPPLKNPLIKEYKYIPFYNETDDYIILPVYIKHNYLIRLIELIKYNIYNHQLVNNQQLANNQQLVYNQQLNINQENNLLEEKFKNKIDELNEIIINTEYFELKSKELNIELNNIELFIKFWIKANFFTSDEKKEEIYMKWFICDYKF